MELKWQFNRAVRASRDLNTSEYAVLLTLSDIADLDGVVPPARTPSNADLAAQAKISERTLHAVIKNTEAKGWLKVIRPTLIERARHKKNQYRLCVPAEAPAMVAPQGAPATVAPVPAPAPATVAVRPPATVAGLKETTKNNHPPLPPEAPTAAAPAARLRREGGARRTEPEPASPTQADALLAKIHPQLEHEHVGRWTRARWRKRLTQALADGWQEADLIRELSKDTGSARSVAGVIDFRLKNLAAPPKPTWTPPPYATDPMPMVDAAVRSRAIADMRANLAAARAGWGLATC